ncbi:MAG: hypothetical protein HQ559_06065 [Lentisphaerae bacterium]|nr:hypothetical protein [Lentisphaerota bacterium]
MTRVRVASGTASAAVELKGRVLYRPKAVGTQVVIETEVVQELTRQVHLFVVH